MSPGRHLRPPGSPLRTAVMVVWCLVFGVVGAGCRGWISPLPPDEARVHQLQDPYASLPPRGGEPDLQRVERVLDAVSASLGYGTDPRGVLRHRATEAWARRLVLLLAHGGDLQLEAAYRDVLSTCVEAAFVPPDLKVVLRRGEGRVYDLRAAGASQVQLRTAYLAEITWALTVLAPLGREKER